MYENGYVPPILTADSIVLQVIDGELHVLLIRRAQEPFKDMWALPGGYIAAGETTLQATYRILEQKAGIAQSSFTYIAQQAAFDTVARDPRGHAVSIAYMALCRNIEPLESKSTHRPQFFPVSALPDLAYDHDTIIQHVISRLRSEFESTTIAFALLAPEFTLTQLQKVYETVLGHELDKRNFRKKFLSLGVLEETNQLLRDGAHRPAKLYRFTQQKLTSLYSDFR